jgi:hypothetical protein
MTGHSWRPRVWRRPSPTGVIAVIALVLACAGSAAAGSLITSGTLRDAAGNPETHGAALAPVTVGTPFVPRGARAVAGVTYRFIDATVPANGIGANTSGCAANETALGGGASVVGTADFGDSISQSQPVTDGSGWTAEVMNAGSAETFRVWAVCVA